MLKRRNVVFKRSLAGLQKNVGATAVFECAGEEDIKIVIEGIC
jgi:hypothetical protein